VPFTGYRICTYSRWGEVFLQEDLSRFRICRRRFPKEQPSSIPGGNLKKNLQIVETIKKFCSRKKCAPSQLALAWCLAQGEDIVPIPGTKEIELSSRKY